MLALSLAPASAAPVEGAPLPLVSHGRVRVTVGLSGDRYQGRQGETAVQFSEPARTLQVELVLLDGLSVWGQGSSTTTLIEAEGARARLGGWSAGGGLDGLLWPAPWLGVALQASARAGMAFDKGDDALLDVWHRTVEGTGTLSVVLGPRDQGVYGWLGARGQTWLLEDTDLVQAELDLSLSRAQPISGVVGFEMHSSDLTGWGSRGSLFASIGGELRLGDGLGGGMWLGLAF